MYVGEVRNGVPNGHGTWTHPNGGKYVGEWSLGIYDGKGKLIYGGWKRLWNEEYFDGIWKNGTAWEGEGKKSYSVND